FRQYAEAKLRDDAVLARQRDDISQRPNRSDLHERRQPVRMAGAGAQRLNQLQRHPDTGEVLVWISAVVTLRIDDRQRVRQLNAGLVMIRDDQIDAQLASPR